VRDAAGEHTEHLELLGTAVGLLGALGGGDVASEKRERLDLSTFEDRTDDPEQPLIDDRRVNLEGGRDAFAERLVERRLHCRLVFGLDEVERRRSADQLLFPDTGRGVIDEDVPVTSVDDHHEVERIFDDRTPSSLGVAKLCFERAPLRDVRHQSHGAPWTVSR
jgi:hypothetical protein